MSTLPASHAFMVQTDRQMIGDDTTIVCEHLVIHLEVGEGEGERENRWQLLWLHRRREREIVKRVFVEAIIS